MTTINLERNLNFKSFFVKNLYLKKILKKSIYSKLNLTINGITNLVTIKDFWDFFSILEKSLNPENENVLIAIKVNDKIYSKAQLKNIKTINYAEKIFFFLKLLKVTCILILEILFRNNVIRTHDFLFPKQVRYLLRYISIFYNFTYERNRIRTYV